MLIDSKRIYNGDFTHARNRTIQKLFRMIGYGDNIGSGFQKILSAWNKLGYPRPELKELDDVKEVWLTLSLTDIKKNRKDIPSTVFSTVFSTANTVENIREKLGKDRRFSELQKNIILLMINNPQITIQEIASSVGKNRNAINYQLKKLKGLIKVERHGSDKTGAWEIIL